MESTVNRYLGMLHHHHQIAIMQQSVLGARNDLALPKRPPRNVGKLGKLGKLGQLWIRGADGRAPRGSIVRDPPGCPVIYKPTQNFE